MPDIKSHLTRWKNDNDFRTFVGSYGMVLITIIFALYNGYLGISHASAWHGGICIYYLFLILIRGIVIVSERSNVRKAESALAAAGRKRVFLLASILLFLLNLSLVAPFALMVKQERPVSMTLIPAIAMAAYTVYKVVIGSLNLKRKNRSENRMARFLRTINFMDALVSVVTLQNTLVMVHTSGDKRTMHPLTAVTSGLIWAAIVFLSVMNLRQAGKRPETEESEAPEADTDSIER